MFNKIRFVWYVWPHPSFSKFFLSFSKFIIITSWTFICMLEIKMIAWFLQKTQLKRLGFSFYMSNTKYISDSKLFFVPGSKYLNRSDFLGASLENSSKVSHIGICLIKQMQSVRLIFFSFWDFCKQVKYQQDPLSTSIELAVENDTKT